MKIKQYLPEQDYDLPNLDVLSLIFDSSHTRADEDTILHAEAADPTNCITRSQARTLSKRLAYIFRNRFDIGKKGPGKDVVCCISSGQVLLAPVFYGVVAAGGVYSAASSAFTTGELSRQLKQGHATVLIASSDCKDVAVKSAKECGIPPDRVLLFESMGHKRVLQDVTSANSTNYLSDKHTEELDWPRITDYETLKKSCICLLYSSGTTGPPKGVKVSHLNVVSEALIPRFMDNEFYARAKKKDPKYKYEYRTIGHLPVAHIAGLQGYLINPVVAGGPVFWMPKFDFLSFLENCKRHRITFFFTVPPIYLLIAKSPLVTDQFQYMDNAISGAAPMGKELQMAVQKNLGCYVSQTWGMSETTGSITVAKRDEHDMTGSVSPLMPNCRLRIVDDEENDVAEGQEGEFICQGPIVTEGYWDNDEATKESTTADGKWFKTGDIGLKRGNLYYIVDRKKELIKYKGLQVAPAELEAHLISHDLILDAAVIGVPAPDGSGNELPRAYVVADKNKMNEQQIKDFVKEHLAQHKQLRGGVVYLPVIPKSASGKILRRELRLLAKKEEKSNGAKL